MLKETSKRLTIVENALVSCYVMKLILAHFHFIDSKYVDTRTFTRPKKKLFTCLDVNGTYTERKDKASSDELVNIQRNFPMCR